MGTYIMAISVAARKAKGRKLQQWTCRRISEITGYEWGGNGDDKPIESRPMGQSGTDVRMESHIRKLFPFSVECKSQESWGVHEWIKQAKENQTQDTDWLLIAKRSREKPIVFMDADTFFRIYEQIIKQNKKDLGS